jgi:indole-3-acetate monooxygenase
METESRIDRTSPGVMTTAPLAELSAIEALAPSISSRSLEFESARRIPSELAKKLARAGLFRICIPKALGGAELHPSDFVRVIEALSRVDGSTGWCVMIGSLGGALSGWLPETVAREIFVTDPETILGGAVAPSGHAVPVDGGYLVSGHWQWGSGCQNCQWMAAGSLVMDGDKPRQNANGEPEIRLMFYPAQQGEILDTWDAAGLRGTGSHDFRINEVFIPAEHSLLMSTPPVANGVLYRFPIITLFALGPCSVSLGIAQRAVDELIKLAITKSPTFERRTLRQSQRVQAFVGEAMAAIRSARAFLHDAIAAACDLAADGQPLSLEMRRDVRLAAANAAWQSAKAVDLMYHAGGGSAIHSTSPLQRCFRDVHAITQHVLANQSVFEQAGAVYLGVENRDLALPL